MKYFPSAALLTYVEFHTYRDVRMREWANYVDWRESVLLFVKFSFNDVFRKEVNKVFIVRCDWERQYIIKN